MSFFTKYGDITRGTGRTATVIKNIIASMGVKCISMVVSFALVPLTIGYVSSELYGVWLTLSSILTWLSFLDVGFSQGLKNKLTEAIACGDWDKGKRLVSTTYFMMLIIFLPACVVLEAIVPLIDWCTLLNVDNQYADEIDKVLYIMFAMVCLQMVVNILISVAAAFQKVALSNTFIPIGNLISLVIIYVLTKTCPPSLVVLACSLAAMPVLVTIIASIILYKGQFKKVYPEVKCIDIALVKDLFGLGYKFFIINVQVIVLYQSTNILISNVSSPNEVTTYNIAYNLLSVAMMIYSMITSPLWPAYTDAYTKGDYDWMIKTHAKMGKILLYSILVCGIVTMVSPVIYKIWIGDRVEIPFIMTVVVALYVSVYCWQNLNGTVLVAMSKVKLNVIILTIGMCVHVPLSYLLSYFIGCYGVLCSMLIITSFYAIVYKIQVGKLLTQTATGIWNE